MLKKILYIFVSLILGFVIFYLSWRGSYSKAVINKGNAAIERGEYDFFCRFLDYYEKEPVSVVSYTEDENTTTIHTYNVFSKHVKDDDGNKVTRSGMLLIITDINTSVIHIDEEEPSDDVADDDIVTRLTLTTDIGTTKSYVLSTYGYESSPVILYTISTTDKLEDLKNGTNYPTKITHIKIVDSNPDAQTVMMDTNVDLPLVEHNEEEYWTNLVESGKGGTAFSQKEYNKNFSFSFPEMNQTIIITSITLVILIGLGIFIFWPKKTFVPAEDDDREKYTFATTEEKNKYALAKIARDKREKEERENRYKNVRTDSNLEDVTNKAIVDSLDQENTFEKAIEEDKALEESKEETNTVEENKEEK